MSLFQVDVPCKLLRDGFVSCLIVRHVTRNLILSLTLVLGVRAENFFKRGDQSLVPLV